MVLLLCVLLLCCWLRVACCVLSVVCMVVVWCVYWFYFVLASFAVFCVCVWCGVLVRCVVLYCYV